MSKTESSKFELTAKPSFVQRGIVALRDPDGEFLSAVPFYEKATPATIRSEQQLAKDAAELFAEIVEKIKKRGK